MRSSVARSSTPKPLPPPLPAGRIRLRRAAALLDVNERTVRRRIAEGVFTRQDATADRGPRRAWHLWRDEVEVFLTAGADACRDYRRAKGRV